LIITFYHSLCIIAIALLTTPFVNEKGRAKVDAIQDRQRSTECKQSITITICEVVRKPNLVKMTENLP